VARKSTSAGSVRERTPARGTFEVRGLVNVQRASRLAACWRDLQVVGQTVTIAPEWYPIGGRVYLGMDPSPRLR